MEGPNKPTDMIWFVEARPEGGKERSLLLRKMLMVLFRKGL